MADLLQVEQMSAGYGDAVVLHDVSLTLAPGETLALLGRNGVGKTTFMDTLAGATRQHGGRITLAGRPLHSLPSHARAAAALETVSLGHKINSFPRQLSSEAELKRQARSWLADSSASAGSLT